MWTQGNVLQPHSYQGSKWCKALGCHLLLGYHLEHVGIFWHKWHAWRLVILLKCNHWALSCPVQTGWDPLLSKSSYWFRHDVTTWRRPTHTKWYKESGASAGKWKNNCLFNELARMIYNVLTLLDSSSQTSAAQLPALWLMVQKA